MTVPEIVVETNAPPDDTAIDVSVVIVSYHCRDHVVRCAQAIQSAATKLRTEVIVVDNGSTDGTIEALIALDSDVDVIPLYMNAGFSKANNIGFARAKGRHVLVLNPDTQVADGAIDALAAWLDEHGDAGLAAPRLYNSDGTDQKTARSFPTPAAALFGRRSPLTRWFPNNRWSSKFLSGRDHTGDEPFKVDWVSGAAMMVPAEAIAKTGGFDEDFFLFWEDADWCKRLANAGYEVWTVPESQVTHHEGGTRDHAWSPRLVRNFHRGAYLYWRKHHAPQIWNPARWLGAAALTGRALVVIANERSQDARRQKKQQATQEALYPTGTSTEASINRSSENRQVML